MAHALLCQICPRHNKICQVLEPFKKKNVGVANVNIGCWEIMSDLFQFSLGIFSPRGYQPQDFKQLSVSESYGIELEMNVGGGKWANPMLRIALNVIYVFIL